MASVTTLGLGRTMEKKLHAVGIDSAEGLRDIGSRQAVARLKERIPTPASSYSITWRPPYRESPSSS